MSALIAVYITLRSGYRRAMNSYLRCNGIESTWKALILQITSIVDYVEDEALCSL